jgi:putative ABC transport system ATP-binding protein
MSGIIRLENAVKTAPDGRRALGGVSLAIHAREHVAIRGPAGSGKTSLLRLIAGMDRPDAGQVFVAGQPVYEMDTREAAAFRNRTVGVCLRAPALLPGLPVWENAALPLAVRGVPAGRRRQTAMEQLKALGIAYAAHARPAALSPWEARLAALARALAAGPPILLLDEIAADLPQGEGKRLMELLGGLRPFAESTVLCAAQADWGPLFARTIEMEHGTIREVY